MVVFSIVTLDLLKNTPMKQKQFLLSIIAFTLMLGLSGCSRETYIEAEVIEGYLHTPHGKYKFQNVNDWDDWWKSKSIPAEWLSFKSYIYDSYVIADGGSVIVIYNVSRGIGGFTAINREIKGQKTHFSVKIQETFLKDNLENISIFERNIDWSGGNFGFTYNGKNYGGVRLDSRVPKNTGKTYHIYIAFVLNGEEFLVDFKGKKIRKKRWTTAGGYLSP